MKQGSEEYGKSLAAVSTGSWQWGIVYPEL